jgi:hypothetical protein
MRSTEVEMPKWLSLNTLLICLVIGSGCGGDDKDPLNDPATFVGKYRDSIEYDCNQVKACSESQMKPVGDDWFDMCLQNSADTLNGNPQADQSFVAAYTRCNVQPDTCAYVTCARSKSPYGASHADKFTYQCQQELQCDQLNGMNIGDPAEALAICVGFNIGSFDNFSPQQRTAYDQAFPTCSNLAACDFLGCFEK